MRRPGVLLFAGLTILYMATMGYGGCYDDVPYRFLPLAVIRHGVTTFDPYVQHFPVGPNLHWRLFVHEGQVASLYPPLPGLLAIPVYLVPSLLWDDLPLLLLSRLAASLMTAGAVTVLYATLRRLGAGTRTSVVVATVIGLGTPMFAVASQSLCQHAPASLAVAVGLYCAVRARDLPSGWPVLGILAASLAVAIRPQVVFVVGPLVLWLAYRGRREIGWVLAAGTAPLIATVAYNLAVTGYVTGGYGYAMAEYSGVGFRPGNLVGIAGLLVSPGRGLVVFAPVTLFAVVGAIRGMRQRDPLVVCCAAGFVLTLLVMGSYRVWWGGGTYGPRYLTETMPLLGVLIVFAFQGIRMSRFRVHAASAFVVAAALSVAVQTIGATSPDCDWNSTPRSLPEAPDRLWDWRDPPVLRCLRSGLRLDVARMMTVTRDLEPP